MRINGEEKQKWLDEAAMRVAAALMGTLDEPAEPFSETLVADDAYDVADALWAERARRYFA